MNGNNVVNINSIEEQAKKYKNSTKFIEFLVISCDETQSEVAAGLGMNPPLLNKHLKAYDNHKFRFDDSVKLAKRYEFIAEELEKFFGRIKAQHRGNQIDMFREVG